MAVDTSRKRTKRVKPCKRCKIQRRKCDRPSVTEPCLRCQEAHRECVNDDGPLEMEDDSIDGNFDLQQLSMEVASLKESLNFMERSLQHGRTSTTATPTIAAAPYTKTHTKPDQTIWIPWQDGNSKTSDDHQTYSFHINTDPQTSSLQLSPVTTYASSILSTLSTSSNDSRRTNTANDDEDYQWDLTLINGTLRLESPIRSLKELLAYGNALQRYLSPFAGVFDNTSFLFESTQAQNLLPTVIQVVSSAVVSWGPKSSRGKKTSMLNKYRFVLKRHHPAVLAAADNQQPPISCIDGLVDHYLTCFNTAMPLLHDSSYRAEYETMIRFAPTQHAITMAICSAVCCSTCIHVPYDSYERRILADYFYDRAIDLLSNSFDDPDRRLETVMTVNILAQYQHMMMLVLEGQKWCTLAYMIAKDLQREYQSHPEWLSSTTGNNHDDSGSTISSSSSSSTSSSTTTTGTGPESLVMTDLAPITTDKDLALFSRHFPLILFYRTFCDLILDHNPIAKELLDCHPILYMEDEGDLTRSFVIIYNKCVQLYTHPVILELREQMQRIHLGQQAKVTLELILRYDQVFQDWWQSLPPDIRLCDQNPFDLSCLPFVENCREPLKLVTFVIAVFLKAEANLILAKPSNQAAISHGGTYELVRAIQERALKEALDCTEAMEVAIRNLETNKHHCIFSTDFLIALSDILCTLAASSSVSVKERAQQLLVASVQELRQARFMEGNLVPAGLSPLRLLDTHETKTQSSASNELPPDIMGMYNDYSLPCFAFGFDILRKASMK